MPQPSRKTQHRIERMCAMHAEGASSREIAEALGMNHGSIQKWLRDAGLEPNGGQGSRKKRKRMPPDAATKALLEAQRRLAEVEIPAATTDIPSMLQALHVDLARARRLVHLHQLGNEKGTSTVQQLKAAMEIERDFAARIVELTPREAADPAKDPANLGAAKETRDKLLGLVEAQERLFVCASCGRNPYGKGNGR